MIELREPGLLANLIELELVRFRAAERVFRVPASLLSTWPTRSIAWRPCSERRDDRGQSVDLADDVMRLIQQFRGALRSVGGAPAEA